MKYVTCSIKVKV